MYKYKTITEKDILICFRPRIFANQEEVLIETLTEILNGTYDLEEAREDVLSFRKDKNEA